MVYPEGSTSVIAATFFITERHRGNCGKACYGSKASADRSVKALRRSGKDRKYEGYLHSYVCKQCRAWHVGHTSYED